MGEPRPPAARPESLPINALKVDKLAGRDMADDSLAVVIEGRREDWPGGPRLLMPCPPSREPNARTWWFGAEFDPAGEQVDAHITWMTPER